MYPILGEPFGIPIRAFGVMVALAFLAAYWWSSREARRTGKIDPEAIGDLLMWVMIGGILGARILYVIVQWKEFADEPLLALQIWKGGLVSYGGFVGAFLSGWIFTRRRKIDYVTLGDVCMPGVLLGQAIGRIGCLLVGDDFGKRAEGLPWAIRFPTDQPDSLLPVHLRGEPLHPTQIYMMLQAFTIFLILSWVARHQRFRGQVFYLALILYPIGRSICEIYRGDDDARGIYSGLSTAQWISIPVFLIGLTGFILAARNREPRRAS